MGTSQLYNSRLGAVIDGLNSDRFELCLAAWLETILPFDNLVILAYHQTRPPRMLFSKTQSDQVLEKFESIYRQGAYLLDPFHTLHLNQWPEGLYHLSAIAPDQFKRNRYYREYYQNTSMVDEVAFIIYPIAHVSIHISLGRDITSDQRFTSRQVAAAKAAAPIVCAVAKQHWRNFNPAEKPSDAKTFENLIDQVHTTHGVVLSPRQAQVAELILKGHSSMSIGLQLGVSAQTVKVFRKQLYKKCQISSQAELFNFLMPVLSA